MAWQSWVERRWRVLALPGVAVRPQGSIVDRQMHPLLILPATSPRPHPKLPPCPDHIIKKKCHTTSTTMPPLTTGPMATGLTAASVDNQSSGTSRPGGILASNERRRSLRHKVALHKIFSLISGLSYPCIQR